MKTLILTELAVTAAAAVAFLVVFGDPRRKADPVIGWHLWMFVALSAVADQSLFLLALGVAVPVWLFALTYAGQAGVAVWRLILAIDGRKVTAGPVSDPHDPADTPPPDM